jgi:hypothetical protein
MISPTPPYCTPGQLTDALREQGYALLSPAGLCELAGCQLADLNALADSWNDLALDQYLRDGGRYRRRRHACFIDTHGELARTPHRPHWQPVEYNALHGGMERLFVPVRDEVAQAPAWRALLTTLGQVCRAVAQAPTWYVEAHQFRIDTQDGIGRPTPEGAHRDGVDFVAVVLVDRIQIKGGETRVFQADGPAGQRFTLREPWSLLLLDDARVIHESTPIQPDGGAGHRDTLVLTWRANGFQAAA